MVLSTACFADENKKVPSTSNIKKFTVEQVAQKLRWEKIEGVDLEKVGSDVPVFYDPENRNQYNKDLEKLSGRYKLGQFRLNILNTYTASVFYKQIAKDNKDKEMVAEFMVSIIKFLRHLEEMMRRTSK